MRSKSKRPLEAAGNGTKIDQKRLAERAAGIESRQGRVCVLSTREWIDLQEGIEQADRGELVAD